jgi:hypothetical protein
MGRQQFGYHIWKSFDLTSALQKLGRVVLFSIFQRTGNAQGVRVS